MGVRLMMVVVGLLDAVLWARHGDAAYAVGAAACGGGLALLWLLDRWAPAPEVP